MSDPATRDDLAAALNLATAVASMQADVKHMVADISDIKRDNEAAAGKRGEMYRDIGAMQERLAVVETNQNKSEKWGIAVACAALTAVLTAAGSAVLALG